MPKIWRKKDKKGKKEKNQKKVEDGKGRNNSQSSFSTTKSTTSTGMSSNYATSSLSKKYSDAEIRSLKSEAMTKYTLGTTLIKTDPSKALIRFQTSLEARKKLYGENSPNVLYCQEKIACVYLELEKFDESLALMKSISSNANSLLKRNIDELKQNDIEQLKEIVEKKIPRSQELIKSKRPPPKNLGNRLSTRFLNPNSPNRHIDRSPARQPVRKPQVEAKPNNNNNDNNNIKRSRSPVRAPIQKPPRSPVPVRPTIQKLKEYKDTDRTPQASNIQEERSTSTKPYEKLKSDDVPKTTTPYTSLRNIRTMYEKTPSVRNFTQNDLTDSSLSTMNDSTSNFWKLQQQVFSVKESIQAKGRHLKDTSTESYNLKAADEKDAVESSYSSSPIDSTYVKSPLPLRDDFAVNEAIQYPPNVREMEDYFKKQEQANSQYEMGRYNNSARLYEEVFKYFRALLAKSRKYTSGVPRNEKREKILLGTYETITLKLGDIYFHKLDQPEAAICMYNLMIEEDILEKTDIVDLRIKLSVAHQILADKHLSDGSYEKALFSYNQTIEISELLGGHQNKLNIFKYREMVGDIHILLEEFKKAIKIFDSLLVEIQKPNRISFLSLAADTAADYGESNQINDSDSKIVDGIPKDLKQMWPNETAQEEEEAVFVVRADLHQKLGLCYNALSNDNKEEGCSGDESSGSQMSSLFMLTKPNFRAEAKKSYLMSISLWENVGEKGMRGLVRSLSDLAFIYLSEDNLSEAYDYLYRAHEIFKKVESGDHTAFSKLHVDVVGGLGDIKLKNLEYLNALKLYNEQLNKLHKCPTVGPKETIEVLSKIATIFEKKEMYQKCIIYHKLILDEKKKIYTNPHLQISITHMKIGDFHAALNEVDLAVEHYRKSYLDQNIMLGYLSRENDSSEPKSTYGDLKLILGGINEEYGIDPEVLICRQNLVATNKIGLLLAKVGDYKGVLDHYQNNMLYEKDIIEDKNLESSTIISKQVAIFFNNMGNANSELGDYGKAFECYNYALSREQHIQDANNESRYNLGLLFYKQQRFEDAQEHFISFLRPFTPILSSIKVNSGEINESNLESVSDDVSIFSNFSNMFKKKEEQDFKAKEKQAFYTMYIITDKTKMNVANALNNVGTILHKHHRYVEALTYYKESLQIKTSVYGTNSKKIIGTLTNLAAVSANLSSYNKKQMPEKFLVRAMRILETQKEGNAETFLLSSLWNKLGNLNLKRKNYNTAIKNYKKCLSIRKKLLMDDNHRDVLMVRQNIGSALSLMGRHLEAKQIFEDTLRRMKSLPGNNPMDLGKLMIDLSDMYLKLDDWQLAGQLCQEGLETLEKSGMPTNHPYMIRGSTLVDSLTSSMDL